MKTLINLQNLLLLGILVVSPFKIEAKDIIVTTHSYANDLVKKAKTWKQPSWINDNFEFSGELDLAKGPKLKKEDAFLKNDIYCQLTKDTNKHLEESPGKTKKFFCNPLSFNSVSQKYEPIKKKNGELERIKVKYDNDEIYTEIISTRLFWALGFPADRMYFVPKVHCFGCTAEPFKDIRVDESTLSTPRTFESVAIERKFDADSIIRRLTWKTMPSGPGKNYGSWDERVIETEGWTHPEMNVLRSSDKVEAATQEMQREALTLLNVFLYNWDSRSSNHRLICTGDDNTKTECNGDVYLMVHDLGGTLATWSFPKGERLDVRAWTENTVWKKSETCTARMGLNYSFHGEANSALLYNPRINESGRAFLAKLLKGFIAGPEGRERVRQLFVSANLQTSKKSAPTEMWVDAFIVKANQVIYPMGQARSYFTCPQ